MKSKYTKEVLARLTKESNSIRQICLKLNVSCIGSMHGYISKKIKFYNIDTSHFRRSRTNGNCVTKKKNWEQVLIKKDSGWKTRHSQLKRALIDMGRPHVCSECKCPPVWNKKPLCLQIDHIDGDGLNCLPENVRFLCPNCHTQTSNFGSKKIKKLLYTNCVFCSNKFETNGRKRKYCSTSCSNKYNVSDRKTKIVWPEKKLLIEMLEKSNYTAVGKQLGVSDNAIRKRLKRSYGHMA